MARGRDQFRSHAYGRSAEEPKCGFIVVGTQGTLSSYDYEPIVTIQTREQPAHRAIAADALPAGRRAPVEYMLDCIANDADVAGPSSPALSRIGQQITDSAVLSAREKRTVALLP
jgi:glucose-fructose oxidoreductase